MLSVIFFCIALSLVGLGIVSVVFVLGLMAALHEIYSCMLCAENPEILDAEWKPDFEEKSE